nr:MAG TPA: hypothetical protein [Caudoviricetes sp.]
MDTPYLCTPLCHFLSQEYTFPRSTVPTNVKRTPKIKKRPHGSRAAQAQKGCSLSIKLCKKPLQMRSMSVYYRQ